MATFKYNVLSEGTIEGKGLIFLLATRPIARVRPKVGAIARGHAGNRNARMSTFRAPVVKNNRGWERVFRHYRADCAR